MADRPQVGQIVDHFFLWPDEQVAGQSEGRKAWPCLIVAVERVGESGDRVTVLPITGTPPRASATVVPIPGDLLARIGLDRHRPAWVVIDDANVFVWPGFDLVPQPSGGFVRGVVTSGFFNRVRDAVLAVRGRNRPRLVPRDE